MGCAGIVSGWCMLPHSIMAEPTQPMRAAPEGLTVRLAAAADQDGVIRVFEEGRVARSEGYSDEGQDVRDLCGSYLPPSPNRLWVADLAGAVVVGMVGLRVTNSHAAELCRLRVLPDYRNRGIGTALVTHALGYCRDNSILKLVLDTHVERTQAIKIFERFGFQLARERQTPGRPLLDFYLDLYRDPSASR